MDKKYSQAGQDLFVVSLFEDEYKGSFIDIGCGYPTHINNSKLLEERCWKGVCIDNNYIFNQTWDRTTPFILADALYCDYTNILKSNGINKVIDYLSIDIDGNGKSYTALKKIIDEGFEFKVITIEHDVHIEGFDEMERIPQRKLLTQLGYVLVCGNVSVCCKVPFEDWWINPKYITEDKYLFYKSNDKPYNEILDKKKIFETRKNDKTLINISVLTLTYKRYHILEEAIQSFLIQDYSGESEMVIINDAPDVEYVYNHPRIRIINCKKRFSSIAAKLEYGYKLCNYEFIYRLDDDDLLSPWALNLTREYILNNPDYEVYRSDKHYSFVNNKFNSENGNVNNGNTYTKKYLDRIEFPNISFSEDVMITFGNNSKVVSVPSERHTMIYRWGSDTYHISGLGNIKNDEAFKKIDQIVLEEMGIIRLNPHFNYDYYSQLPLKKVKFIIPLPDIAYYLWQGIVQINNFKKFGYDIDTHYPVCISNNIISEQLKTIMMCPDVKSKFHIYQDNREDKSYSASMKPWLMAQYFKEFPEEKDSIYIYLDPDVIFLKKFDFSKFLYDDIWYESNTCSYLDSGYIKSKGEQLFYEMCAIVGIKPETVIEYDRNCGGAQYITKNNTFEYWNEVEKKSVPLYKHMKNTAEKYHPEAQQYPIQAWTSEMWTTNWVLWKNGVVTKVVPELDFHWANHRMIDLKYSIFHNAGVVENNGIDFAKTFYVNSPFKTEIKGTAESISYKYIEEIKETEINFPEIVSKFKV